MPVTFNPSGNNNSAVELSLLERSRADPTTLLKDIINPELADNIKEVFQSSFDGMKKFEDRIIPSTNGFLTSVIEAYNHHHHLIIRPDDVWITILSQFNFFVNANAEALRHLFVTHTGKKELEIRATGSRHTVDFGKLAEQMGILIQENVIDPDLRSWIIPDFSTTTDNDRVVSSVIMMATLKVYFGYNITLECGLPTVTLLGEKNDWLRLLEKIEKLPSFGDAPAQWHTLLKPVLTHFVFAFDEPDSPSNKSFWQKIAHLEEAGSGDTCLSGWITAFAFFTPDGELISKVSDQPAGITGAVVDGVKYHVVDEVCLPPAYASVDVKLNDNGKKFDTVMVAGMVGYRVLLTDLGYSAGEGGEQYRHDALQPFPGWWLFEKNKETEEKD